MRLTTRTAHPGAARSAARRRGLVLLVLGAIAAGAGAWSWPGRSYADGSAPDGYQLMAAADGVRVTWTVPNFAVVDSPIDGGGPTAQARLDSLGQSTAFASLPYPGDAFVGLPGLLAGFTGLPAAPAYPLYVHSSHPTAPDQKFDGPGTALAAHSDADTSTASASGGSGGDVTVTHPISTAGTTRGGDGTLTATARSAVDAFAVGPLAVHGLASTAKVVRTVDGREATTSSLAAASVTVGGTAAALTDHGLVLAGQSVPVGDNPLTDALAQAGLQVAVTKAVRTDHGVIAPSLAITVSRYSEQIQRPVTMRYVLGASSASALGVAPPPLPDTGAVAPGDSAVGPNPDATAPPAGPPGSDDTSLGAGTEPATAGPTPAAVPAGEMTPSANGAEVAAGPARAGPAVGAATSSAGRLSPVASESAGWAWGSLYLVLVAAGLVLAGGIELIRSLRVRQP